MFSPDVPLQSCTDQEEGEVKGEEAGVAQDPTVKYAGEQERREDDVLVV